MDAEYAKYLLEETRKNYNLTAEGYTRSRAFVPGDIKQIAGYAQEGDRVLDSGCASGRFYGVLAGKNLEYFGIDISEKFIEIAKNNYPGVNFQVGNTLVLPFADNFFDKVFSISVIHNIPSREFQLRYLKESGRVLKPGGLLVLRVWDLWKRKQSVPLIFKYTLLKILGKSRLDFKDVFLPWKDSDGKVLIQRYFHVFNKREIENLVKEAGFSLKKVWQEGNDSRSNIYIVAQKTSP